MPNHIENILIFHTNPVDLNEIVKDGFSFKHISPEPNNDDNYDWYIWRCKHWGTKWDAYDVEEIENYTDETGELIVKYNFNTAWSPPIAWLKTVSTVCPKTNIELYWSDEDVPNCGWFKCIDGNQTCEKYSHLTPALNFLEQYFPHKFDIYQECYGNCDSESANNSE